MLDAEVGAAIGVIYTMYEPNCDKKKTLRLDSGCHVAEAAELAKAMGKMENEEALEDCFPLKAGE